MANPTARALIIDAYQTSGIRGLGQAVTDEDTAVGLRYLNYDLIDILRTERLWSPFVREYNFITENNKETYTIGLADPVPTNPQPDIVVNQEIVQVLQAQVQVGSVWNPLRQISPEDYYRMTQNDSITTVPTQFTYNRSGDPFDEIKFSNSTLASYPIRLAVNGEVQNYALDDTIDLPSGYYSALKFGLAEFIADAYGLDSKALSLNTKYASAMRRLKDVVGNPVPKLSLNFGRTRYDITSDVMVNARGGI